MGTVVSKAEKLDGNFTRRRTAFVIRFSELVVRRLERDRLDGAFLVTHGCPALVAGSDLMATTDLSSEF